MNRIIATLIIIAGTCAAGDAPPTGGGDLLGDGKPPHQGPPPEGGRPPRPEELFKLADANGDGKVSKEELSAALDKQRKAGREKMFDAMDANHDGNVSKEEFLAFEPPQGPPGGKPGEGPGGKPGEGPGGKPGEGPRGQRQPNVEQMMKHFDLNGDGFITEEEISQAKEQRQKEKGGKDGGGPPKPGQN